jgi:hypothetical protein
MRLRMLLLTLLTVLISTGLVNSWPWGAPVCGHSKRPGGRSHALAISYLGWTNGNAVLEVKNLAARTTFLSDYVIIEYRNPVDASDYITGEYLPINNTLPPGGACKVSFIVDNNRLHWRAVAGEVEQVSKRATDVYYKIPWAWQSAWAAKLLPKQRFDYAETDWIAPRNFWLTNR